MNKGDKIEEIDFLLQELNRVFKNETGISLENSMKAYEYIHKNKKDKVEEVSDRFLRDHWPSLVKSKSKDYKIGEETDKKKKQTSTLNLKTINKPQIRN